MTRRDSALLVGLGAVWGAVYPLTAVVLRDLPVPTVVAARTTFAALVLVPAAWHRQALAAVRAHPLAIVVAGVLQATLPLVLLTTGQQHVGAGLAGILLASQPVWAAMVTTIVTRTADLTRSAGVLLGLCGVGLIFVRDLEFRGTSSTGTAALLAAAMLFAVGAVYIERVLPGVPPLTTATVAMALSAAALAPFAAVTPTPLPGAKTVGWLFMLGAIDTGAALVLFYTLIQRLGAVSANVAGYLAPGFAVAYGVVFLGERVKVEALAGLVLIVAGSYVATRGSVEKGRRRSSH